jgi:hypothetical protein
MFRVAPRRATDVHQASSCEKTQALAERALGMGESLHELVVAACEDPLCASFLSIKPAQQALVSRGQPSVSTLRRRIPPIEDGEATPRLAPSSRVVGGVRGAGARGAGH